jgi:hypothetical protein
VAAVAAAAAPNSCSAPDVRRDHRLGDIESDLPAKGCPVDAVRELRRFLASFTDDGVVDDWGREFAGADAIRGWSDAEFKGVEVTLAVTGVTTEGADDDPRLDD